MTRDKAFELADMVLTAICGRKKIAEHGAIVYWSDSGIKVVANRTDFGDKFIKRNFRNIVGVYDQLVSVDMLAHDIMASLEALEKEI